MDPRTRAVTLLSAVTIRMVPRCRSFLLQAESALRVEWISRLGLVTDETCRVSTDSDVNLGKTVYG